MSRRTAAVVFGIALTMGAAVSVRAGGVLETIDLTNALASPLAGQLVARVIGMRWDVRAIPVQYRVNTSTGPTIPIPFPPPGQQPVVSLQDATATMQQAFDAWNDLPASFIEMHIVGEVNNPGGRGFDFVNELTFVTPSTVGAIASSPSVSLMADMTFADGDDIDEDGDADVSAAIRVTTDVDGDGDLEFPAGFYTAGTILDNDVQFNTKTGPPSALGVRFTVGDEALDTHPRSVDLFAVAVHEFGHSHGLSHSMDNQTSGTDGGGATMFPFIDTTDPEAERQVRSLHTDDIAWSSYLYPEGSASSGPAALQTGDVAFTQLFGLIAGEVRHGVLDEPLAGASVYAIDTAGDRLQGSGFSGTANLSVDPVSGALFFLPRSSDAIVDGRYVIPVSPGSYAVGVEAVDGRPAAAGNISLTAQTGAFFGQQNFHEEFYGRGLEQEIEVRPGRRATVHVRRGRTTSGIDIVTNTTLALTGFTQTADGFTDAEPGRYYAVAVPASLVAAVNPGGELLAHVVLFTTAVADASVVPAFAEAMLTTGTLNADGTAAIDLLTPLDQTADFIGQDGDVTPFFLTHPRALGQRIRRGIEQGDIQHLFLVLRIPTTSPFPGVSGLPPLVGLDQTSAPGRSFQSSDGGATFTPVAGANFMFSLVFAGIPQEGSPAPVVQDGAVTTMEETAVVGMLTGTDPNGAPLTFSAVSSPVRGSVNITSATGAFRYTPPANFFGTDSFFFRASNGRYPSNVGTVTVTVTPVNDAPVVSSRRVTTAPETAVTGTLVASDVEGDTLTFSVVAEPLHGVVLIAHPTTGEFVYTPASGFVGTDRFTFQVSDGLASSNVATLTITVGVPDPLPPLSSVVVTTQEGVAVRGSLQPASPGGGATFSIVSPPAMGVLTITDAATGAFTYAPNPGAVGYDTFAFAAADGGGSLTGNGLVFIVAAAPRWPGHIARVQTGFPVVMAAVSADGRYIAFEAVVHDRTTGETTRVSLANDGSQGSGFISAVSADGRYVAFFSNASNLVAGDTNGTTDVFVHDRLTGETTRVSVASDGTQGNSTSSSGTLSADGRYVVFLSAASNLVAGDTNGIGDVFVHDRATGETTRVSVASDGTQGSSSQIPTLSADGRYVAFSSSATNLVAGDTNGVQDAFVHDRVTGETTRVSMAGDGTEANGESFPAALSADGRYVALSSAATNLVAGDTNGAIDAFVHDRATGQTTRVSVASDGTQLDNSLGASNPRLSADGRYAAFGSNASNLVPNDTNGVGDVFVHDGATGETRLVSVSDDGSQGTENSVLPGMSADGQYVVFLSGSTLVPGDTNRLPDIFVVGGVSGDATTP